MGVLERYRQLTQQGVAGQQVADNAVDPTTLSTPVVDSSNAIGSLANLLGPTPAEREAQERRMMEGKAKMSAWTGLFDGLRQLGNLYYTAKGATPQNFANPYQFVDQQYQQQRQLYNDMANYRKQYASSLYSMQRQLAEDKRKNKLVDAQARYYDTRDEMARQKAENDRQKAELEKLKAVRVIKNANGSLSKFDPVTGELTELSPADPLYVKYKQSQIDRNNRTGTGGRSGSGTPYKEHYVEEEVDPVTGNKVKKYVAGKKPDSSTQKTERKEKRQSRTRI